MKILAVVTILFLPGSFVAAVFSMPLSNWGSENSDGIVNSHFGPYWAVTVPLTLFTFVSYGMWLLMNRKSWNRKGNDNVRAMDGNPYVAELKKLTWSRRDILSDSYSLRRQLR